MGLCPAPERMCARGRSQRPLRLSSILALGMSAATPAIRDSSLVLRRRELVVGAAVTAALAAFLIAVGPAPGDAPAHLYRTLLLRHGTFVWDNFWYDGSYPFASYSLLYYLPAALVGNLPIIFAAAVLKLPDLAGSQGNGVRGPALVGALCAALSAYLAVRFLMRYFETRTLTPFAIYCLCAGTACAVYFAVT